MEQFEVVIIGAGAAGLSAALLAGRSCRKVLVLDGGPPRNAVAHEMHSVLSRDGMNPLEYLAAGRKDLEQYDVTIREARAASIETTADKALVTLESADVIECRAVIVATGTSDSPIDLPGVRDLWGTDIAHCPYCHAWEYRNQPIGAIGTHPMSGHQPLLLRQWSDDVIYFPHEQELSDEERTKLEAIGVQIVEGLVREVAKDGDRMRAVVMEDGREFERNALWIVPNPKANDSLLAGAERNENGTPVLDMMNKTSLDRVWAAGEVSAFMGASTVVEAVAQGARAGAGANATLIFEDADRAVAAL